MYKKTLTQIWNCFMPKEKMFLSMFSYEAYKIEYCNIYKYDLDSRLDFENYKELLITASSNEDHLQFNDNDSYECLGKK